MDNCIFCKIVKGEIPSTKVYEDDSVLAFLDIKPVNPGHTLVITKQHYENFTHTDPLDLQKLILQVQAVADAVIRALGAEGFNLGLNNGAAAGQLVPHVHFHIMPRFSGDGHQLWHGKPYQLGEMEAVAAKIRGIL